MFPQDGVRPHIHHLTQKWCQDNFPSFIDKDHWPPNSPDLNALDYCIWELKCAVKEIQQDVVLQSCLSWTIRLQHVLKNDESFLRK